jgi:hypothetical protein
MRSAAEVLAYCRAEHDSREAQWYGYCQKFTRSAFGVGSLYGSAVAAWNGADMRHGVSSGAQVPRAVPVFWTGGSHGYGHVAVSVGGGLCWSTDFRRHGDVDLVRIDDITRSWNLHLAGWSEDINEVTVYQAPDTSMTPRIDQIIELARAAMKVSANRKRDEDMAKIVARARPWSAKY